MGKNENKGFCEGMNFWDIHHVTLSFWFLVVIQ
jgi:hypothetical protein